MSVNAKMTAIADEVRTLAGVADKLNLDDMAAHTHDANTEVGTQENLIEQIRTALQGKSAVGDAEPIIQPLEVTENGTYTAPDGVDGYSPVTVNVPVPDGYIKPSGELEVTEYGIHDVTAYASVNVVNPEASSIFDPTQETILTRSTATYKDLFVAKTIIAYVNTGKYAGYAGCKFDAVVGETYRISWDNISSSEEFVFYYESDTILTKVDDHYGTRIQHTNNPFTLTATKPYVYLWVAHPAVPSTTLVFVTGLMVHEVVEV